MSSISLTGTFPLTELEIVLVSRSDPTTRLGIRRTIWDLDNPDDIVDEPIAESVIGFLIEVGSRWRSMTPEAITTQDSRTGAHAIRWYRPR
jgi:hypothetical protein